MKRKKSLRILIGIIIISTFFINATLGASFIHPHHLLWRTKHFHAFPLSTELPDLGFLWKLSSKMNWWKTLGVSEEQHIQMREEFREFLFRTIELRQELEIARQEGLTEIQTTSDEHANVAHLRTKITTLEQQLRQASADHMAAMHTILTPEQDAKLQQQRAAKRMLGKLRAGLQHLVLTQSTPEIKITSPGQEAIAEEIIISEQERPEMGIQERIVGLSPRQHLHTLQILRV